MSTIVRYFFFFILRGDVAYRSIIMCHSGLGFKGEKTQRAIEQGWLRYLWRLCSCLDMFHLRTHGMKTRTLDWAPGCFSLCRFISSVNAAFVTISYHFSSEISWGASQYGHVHRNVFWVESCPLPFCPFAFATIILLFLSCFSVAHRHRYALLGVIVREDLSRIGHDVSLLLCSLAHFFNISFINALLLIAEPVFGYYQPVSLPWRQIFHILLKNNSPLSIASPWDWARLGK